jgi:hypothetical protein
MQKEYPMGFVDEMNAYRDAGLMEKYRIMVDMLNFYYDYSHLF